MDLKEIQQKSISVLQKYGVARAFVFGSYSRGEQNSNSDIDLIIEPESELSLFDEAGLESELQKALGIPADLICVSGKLQAILKKNFQMFPGEKL
ncbi:MAG: nucleotidyltransferase domain-containing protein [Firmicutes bacterium]|nr:nucleotidyltransferase domain-containing protein [Bacillota bacterium]